MVGYLKINTAGSKACKLCHGPLTSPVAVPASPAMQNTASRMETMIPVSVDCHSHCMSFACPGCVAKDKKSYSILNMKNHIYDYSCQECMNEVPLAVGSKPSLISRETATAAIC